MYVIERAAYAALFSWYLILNYMGNIITKISLTISADTNLNNIDTPVTVNIQAIRGVPVSERRFLFYIYSHDFYQMSNNDDVLGFKRVGGNRFDITLNCNSVWLPGNYILIVRDVMEHLVIRVNFKLNDKLEAVLGEQLVCPSYSLEGILTSYVENTEEGWDVLSKVPGAVEMRQYALKGKQLKVYNEFREQLGGNGINTDWNLLIYTCNNDWNQDTLMKLYKMVTWGTYFTYVDCSTLYDVSSATPYEKLSSHFCSSSSQVFCLANLSNLLSGNGKVIVKYIVDRLHEKNNYNLWICGSHQEINALLDMHPSLRDFFLRDNHIEQKPYSGFDLVQTFFSELANEHLKPTAEAKDALSVTLLNLHRQGSLASWTRDDIRRFIADEIRPSYLNRVIGNVPEQIQSLPRLTIDDVKLENLPHTVSAFDDCIAELNQMVGLDDIKHSIVTMANQTRFFVERRNAGLRTSASTVHHAIFTGNPGTGKTTVAKLLGKIYHSIGLLSKGNVICADRTRLIGRYIGETEENMKIILEEARGNVLFIDEAYTLYENAADTKDFGRKVIDSLLTVLSQRDPDMIIIFAGYEKEIDTMLNSNPGLMGRFPYKFRFTDYNADQLMEIACNIFSCDEYILTQGARLELRRAIDETLLHRTKNFGNARWIEQFVNNGIIPAMADRITRTSTGKDYQHILASDVEEGFRHFNPLSIVLKPRQRVGFSA